MEPVFGNPREFVQELIKTELANTLQKFQEKPP